MSKPTNLVPAHPPSKADPAAQLVGIALGVAAMFGVDVTEYLDGQQLLTLAGLLIFLASSVRSWAQHKAAKGA